MKAIFIILICVLSNTCFSQYYLGYSKNEVMKQIRANEGNKFTITNREIDNNVITLGWENKLMEQTVFFGPNNLSFLYSLVPKNDTVLKSYIQILNKKHVIISEKEWRAYSNGKTYTINLEYVEDIKQYSFLITKI